MKVKHRAAADDRSQRRDQLAKLICDSYPGLRSALPSAYADGEEVYRALLFLGREVSEDSPELIAQALGWEGIGLPVANVDGRPKFYIPRAVPGEKSARNCLTDQVAICVKNLREFKRSA